MKKPLKQAKKEPIPELICVRKPTKGSNDGQYTIRIPLKYIIEACKAPAAFFEFRFVGLRGEWR